MPKATLTFDLPEENAEFLRASLADKLAGVIWQFTANGHRDYKSDNKCSSDFYEGIRQAQSDIFKLLEEECIDIDRIYV